MVDRLNAFAFEVSKVAREVGTEGILGGQAEVEQIDGKWKDLTGKTKQSFQNHFLLHQINVQILLDAALECCFL